MLEDVLAHLACPVCRAGLARSGQAVRCPRGHAFDVARQGYVSLLTGSGAAGTADTPAMVAARERFLAEGHYAPLAERLAHLVTELLTDPSAAAGEAGRGVVDPVDPASGADRPLIVDAGAGTGHLLARVLDRAGPHAVGLALDISKHAIKRAARAHPRIGAVVADVWRPIPIRDGRAALVMNAFAPRNGPEFARILAPGGTLVVVTPAPGHLGDLVGELGLLSVDRDKDRRLAAALAENFRQTGEDMVDTAMTLDHAAVEAVVRMGPSAWHTDPAALRRRIANLPGRSTVPGRFRITIWKPVQ